MNEFSFRAIFQYGLMLLPVVVFGVGAYLYAEELRTVMRDTTHSVNQFSFDERARDDQWFASEQHEHQSQLDVLRDTLKVQSDIRTKLAENNGLMQAILSSSTELNYNLGIYQGHHEDDNHAQNKRKTVKQ